MKKLCAVLAFITVPSVAFAQIRQPSLNQTFTAVTEVTAAPAASPTYPAYQITAPTPAPVAVTIPPIEVQTTAPAEVTIPAIPNSDEPNPAQYMDPSQYPTGPNDIDTVTIGGQVCAIQSIDGIQSAADAYKLYSPYETLKTQLTISCMIPGDPPATPKPDPAENPTTCDAGTLQTEKFSIVYDKTKGTVSEQLAAAYKKFAWKECDEWSGKFCKIVVPGYVDRAKAPCMFKEWKYDPAKFKKGEKNEGKIAVTENPKGTFNLDVSKICYFECKDCKIPTSTPADLPKFPPADT